MKKPANRGWGFAFFCRRLQSRARLYLIFSAPSPSVGVVRETLFFAFSPPTIAHPQACQIDRAHRLPPFSPFLWRASSFTFAEAGPSSSFFPLVPSRTSAQIALFPLAMSIEVGPKTTSFSTISAGNTLPSLKAIALLRFVSLDPSTP